jgi:type II secretory pathway pseudopilin PulG
VDKKIRSWRKGFKRMLLPTTTGGKNRKESGATLLETLIALAILCLTGMTFLGGLSTAYRAGSLANVRTNAASLARSQMEYVRSQPYINYGDSGHEDYGVITAPGEYSIMVDVVPIDPNSGQPLPAGQDNGVQKVTVILRHNNRAVLTMESYKADR